MFTIYVYVLDTLADWEMARHFGALFRPVFQKGRAACISQNSQLY